MKRIIVLLVLSNLLSAGCTLPEPKGPWKVCIPDSGFCWFEDTPPWESRR